MGQWSIHWGLGASAHTQCHLPPPPCSLPPGTWAHLASSSPFLPQNHCYPLPGPEIRPPQQRGETCLLLPSSVPGSGLGAGRWGRVGCMPLWCLECQQHSTFVRCIRGTLLNRHRGCAGVEVIIFWGLLVLFVMEYWFQASSFSFCTGPCK